MGGFSSNLVRWCRMTTCSRKRDNFHFGETRWRQAPFWILKKLRRIEGFGSNFVY